MRAMLSALDVPSFPHQK